MNFKKLQDTLSEYMTHSISFYDGGTEGFYHGMIIGLVAMLDNKYHVRSNRESGDGRYDVCLFPKEKEYPGIIMEFKWKAGLDLEKLEELAKEAREQIDVNRYDIEITEYKVTDIIKIGIAFSGKPAKVYPNKR